ncbi:MAG: hypothetical protein GC189_06765 [Alphaproteobacteria bacterium]|nr:hypothetical protein [Alphaproteobacteria bacterium]
MATQVKGNAKAQGGFRHRSPLGAVLGSLALGVAAITLGALAPSLQTSRAIAHEPAPVEDRIPDSLFPVVATTDAISAAELAAIEAQIDAAEATIERHRAASSGAVALLSRHARGGSAL